MHLPLPLLLMWPPRLRRMPLAFASQATYCVEKLGLDSEKVNVNGGAIALGHPLGATGARCLATLIHEMHRRGAKTGVVSMCIGSGMGMASAVSID